MTAAGADLADEVGFANLSMSLLAERLGVRTPSLYKHVQGQADLAHRIAVLAVEELADAILDATRGLAGREALLAGAHAMRDYVREHPGRYEAGDLARTSGPDDPLVPAVDRVLEAWAGMLRGYDLPPEQEVHALRVLRSLVHGFVTLDAAGGFQMGVGVDDSFGWMLGFLDRGLRAAQPATPPASAHRRPGSDPHR